MDSLFKKLNLLVKATVSDLIGGEDKSEKRPIGPGRLGKNIDKEIRELRGRVDQALQYEDELQRKLDALIDDIAEWDRKADDAVGGGREEDARYAVQRMQAAMRQRSMIEADLDEHRMVTQELIGNVNQLEAVVQEAQRQQAAKASSESAAPVDSAAAEKVSGGIKVLSDALRDARDKVGDILSSRTEAAAAPSPMEEVEKEIQNAEVDDELAQRRARLSKPPQNKQS